VIKNGETEKAPDGGMSHIMLPAMMHVSKFLWPMFCVLISKFFPFYISGFYSDRFISQQ
jgi:hypothetical protein